MRACSIQGALQFVREASGRLGAEALSYENRSELQVDTQRVMKRLAASMALLAILVAWLAVPVRAQQTSERTRAIGKKLKCMCRGCQDTAATCYHTGAAFSGPCATAKGMLKEIDERVAKGDSDDLILQSFVQQYGQEVYIEPPHSGIGSLAWAMPTIYLVLGTGLVVFVISRWRKRTPQAATASGPSVATISPEALEQARRRVARDTED
jgi:cytochrome c-type biogenesis protein CcmH/NrfF